MRTLASLLSILVCIGVVSFQIYRAATRGLSLGSASTADAVVDSTGMAAHHPSSPRELANSPEMKMIESMLPMILASDKIVNELPPQSDPSRTANLMDAFFKNAAQVQESVPRRDAPVKQDAMTAQDSLPTEPSRIQSNPFAS